VINLKNVIIAKKLAIPVVSVMSHLLKKNVISAMNLVIFHGIVLLVVIVDEIALILAIDMDPEATEAIDMKEVAEVIAVIDTIVPTGMIVDLVTALAALSVARMGIFLVTVLNLPVVIAEIVALTIALAISVVALVISPEIAVMVQEVDIHANNLVILVAKKATCPVTALKRLNAITVGSLAIFHANALNLLRKEALVILAEKLATVNPIAPKPKIKAFIIVSTVSC